MTFVGIIIGLMIGAAFESFIGAIVLAALGGFVGYQLARKSESGQEAAARANTASGTAANLQLQLNNLKGEMHVLAQRMAAVERQLHDETTAPDVAQSAAAPTPAEASASVDEEELARQAMAAPSHDIPPPAENPAPAAPAILAAAVQSDARASVAPAAVLGANATPVSPAMQAAAQAEQDAPPAEATPSPEPTAPVQSAPPKTPRPPPTPTEPSWIAQLIQRWVIGGNPLVKVGVLILFLGLAFLLRYVAEHTVVPVELRYAGVAAMGIGLLLFGWRWRHRADNYGLILQGAGIGVMYLTTLAAMRLHPLIPLEFGFVVLFAVAAFAALLAILQNALALAIVGTLFGFAAPVLASSGSANHVAFFSYLALINLGIVAIAWFKAWRILNLIGFGSSLFLGCAWGVKYWRPELLPSVEPFLLLLFGLYVLIAFLFARRTLAQAPQYEGGDFEQHVRQSAPHVSYVDGTLVFGVPFATFGLQYLIVRHIEYGAAFAALGFGLAYILLAFLLFRKTGMRYALLNETMIALAVIFGSLAIPLALEQEWTAAAWAVEAAGVYWVGIRQQRVYARLFALLLLFGSAVYFALGLDIAASGPVLDGSLLGCVMLAASVWWTYRLLRAAPVNHVHGFERAMQPWLVAFGAFFIAATPFLLWPMAWAATALAILGTVAVFAAQKMAERALLIWGCIYQGLAGALFMTTLRSTGGGSVLANGWTGLLTASLIGASMLVGIWAVTRGRAGTAEVDKVPAKPIGGVASLGLLAGLAFINLAPLFVLPWRFAAMVWPITGLATLWWAVRMRHGGAIGFALALQVIAGLSHFGSRLVLFGSSTVAIDAKPFLHSAFLGPLLIACAAFICARLLHRRRPNGSEPRAEATLGWLALTWAGAWWAFAWADELARLLPTASLPAAMIGAAIATAWLWSALARRLQWPQLGQATLAYVPALILLAAIDRTSPSAHPLADWGVLAWPLALAMHFLLLHRQSAWVGRKLHDLAHIGGAWLFVVIAAIELRWLFGQWTSADTAWPLLGWMVVPVLYLWLLTVGALRQRWPIKNHLQAYAVVSALPIVLYLLGWVWIANLVSNGAAAPLPFVPLVNPLELAQLAVLTGVVLWWWSLRDHPLFADRLPLVSIVTGASAFAVITGSVARACHHWGGVPWRLDALLASPLFQTSLSIVWSVLAIGVMIFGNRKQQRWVWIAGAVLIAVVVAKLFLVELAARGSLTRIVSFIVVGLLLLLVGYFAPLPPKRDPVSEPADSIAA